MSDISNTFGTIYNLANTYLRTIANEINPALTTRQR